MKEPEDLVEALGIKSRSWARSPMLARVLQQVAAPVWRRRSSRASRPKAECRTGGIEPCLATVDLVLLEPEAETAASDGADAEP